MYNTETLAALNTVYLAHHREITQSDVDYANKLAAAISGERQDGKKVHTGDFVEYTNKWGDYFDTAHADSFNESTAEWSVCEHPYIPFVKLEKDGSIYQHKLSGGPWGIVPAEMRYIGKRKRLFAFFGVSLTAAYSAIYFEAEVNVWEYTCPDQLYGGYTTKNWKRHYFSFIADSSGRPVPGHAPYRYLSFSSMMAFVDKKDFDAWLRTYRGVTFEGASAQQIVVFCYREQDYLIDKDKWEALDLPLDTRPINGVNLVKVRYDDENHIVHTYRYTNAGQYDRRECREYARARGTDLRNMIKGMI